MTLAPGSDPQTVERRILALDRKNKVEFFAADSVRILLHDPEDSASLHRLLTEECAVAVAETRNLEEVYPDLQEAGNIPAKPSENIRGHSPLLSLLHPGEGYSHLEATHPVAGHTLEKNMDAVDSLLAIPGVQELFAGKTRFLWTATSHQTGTRELIAVKVGSSLELNANTVAKTEVMQNDSGYWDLTVTLEKEFAGEWARMTEANIHRWLAVIANDSVLMYARVMQRLDGGVLGIAGPYDRKTMKELAAMIEGGKLYGER